MPETLRQIAAVLDDMQAKHRFLAAQPGRRRTAPDAADALIEELEAEAAAIAAPCCAIRRGARSPGCCCRKRCPSRRARDGVAGAAPRRASPCGEIVVNRVTPPPPGAVRAVRGPPPRGGEGPGARPRARSAAIPLRVVAALEDEPEASPALRRVRAGAARSGRPRPIRRGAGRAAAPRERSARPALRRARRRSPGGSPALAAAGAASPRLRRARAAWARRRAAATAALAAGRAPGRRRVSCCSPPTPRIPWATRSRCRSATTSGRCPGAPPRLRARELDADRALAAARERYRSAVDELFDALRGGSNLDPAYDRAVVQDLIDLAPPGIDELFALVAVTDAPSAEGADAPDDGGPRHRAHRPRAAPARAARGRAGMGPGLPGRPAEVPRGRGPGAARRGPAWTCRSSSASLEALLRDPARTAFVAVTRPAELPRRETERLLDELDALGHPRGRAARQRDDAARLRALPPRGRREERAGARPGPALLDSAAGRPMILAPMVAPAPRGRARAAGLGATWRWFDRAGAALKPRPARPRRRSRRRPPICTRWWRARGEPTASGAPDGLPGLGPLRWLAAGRGLWLAAADAPLAPLRLRRHREGAEGPRLGVRLRDGPRARGRALRAPSAPSSP